MSAQTVNTTVASTFGITYTPTDAWFQYPGPEAIDGDAEYLNGDNLNGRANSFIAYTFTQPATGLEYWGYQRSDGGNFSICFDCPPTYNLGYLIDALNTSTNGTQPPILLYAKYDLSYAVHNITIANLFDSRATINNNPNGPGGYGQMNLEHLLLIAPATPPTSSTQGSSSGSRTSAETSSSSSSPTAPAAGGSSSSNTGAIAGAVVGGLAALASIAVILFFLFRKRKQSRLMDGQAEGMVPKDTVNMQGNSVIPFILGAATQDGQATRLASWPSAAPSNGSGPSTVSPSVHGSLALRLTPAPVCRPAPRPKGASQMSAEPVTRTYETVTSPSINPATTRSSEPIYGLTAPSAPRDQDAGFLQGDDEPEMLPPDYDAATSRRLQAGQQ